MGKSSIYVDLPNGVGMQVGEWAFTTTGLTVEVPTKFQTLISTIATPEAHSAAVTAGRNVMFCDKAITSGAVTFERKADGGTGTKFSYRIYGTFGAHPSDNVITV